jgi:spore maturation protein CgeB
MNTTLVSKTVDQEYRPLAPCLATPARVVPIKASAARNILYVGDTAVGCTSEMRLEALRRLGHFVEVIPRTHSKKSWLGNLPDRLLWKLGYPRDHGLNRAIRASLSGAAADILWCDRPVDVWPETLQAAKASRPSLKIVAYSLDDMLETHTRSAYYLRSIALYDLHVTTKSFNVSKLAAAGARSVLFVNNAYSPRVHFPMAVTAADRIRYGGAVGFVGTYERERAEMLVALAKEQIRVRVWGGSWPSRLRSASRYLRIECKELMGDLYRLALNSFDINLGFLRKMNRDLQTTRSVEIPASGAFLLAERTEEHQALFQEDSEAAYFGSKEELIAKVKYYLENESLRKRVAWNGLRRAAGAYTYEIQLQNVLAAL